ncbi:MAG TPA: RdgB/HAM1 family non-canonical purine NTP pyrophosphatase [Flavobacteriales bacterium]|nr:RdgB/HAM1 family non-canonical purine NTP pyrophosphatase [Flavobacteriales bacterium]
MKLVLCTRNPGKVAELATLLPPTFHVIGPDEVGVVEELPETGDTLEANAEQKARWVHDRCGLPCIADDSGLEVDALGGAPGVHSAHYAGEARDPGANMRKLLRALEGHGDRTARFRTVIAFVEDGRAQLFHGVVKGRILSAPRGTAGFGYDPLFAPEGEERSFAEMTTEKKNRISHRARAMAALLEHVRTR